MTEYTIVDYLNELEKRLFVYDATCKFVHDDKVDKKGVFGTPSNLYERIAEFSGNQKLRESWPSDACSFIECLDAVDDMLKTQGIYVIRDYLGYAKDPKLWGLTPIDASWDDEEVIILTCSPEIFGFVPASQMREW